MTIQIKLPQKFFRKKLRFSSSRIIILGFFLAILCGSLLLMLPIASREGRVTPFLDTLFTATSAVCVTGLVVYDTATYWSGFGQAVIPVSYTHLDVYKRQLQNGALPCFPR